MPCVQGYLAMVRSAKNGRLQDVLKQTDQCLQTFANKLGLQDLMQNGRSGAVAVSAGRCAWQLPLSTIATKRSAGHSVGPANCSAGKGTSKCFLT